MAKKTAVITVKPDTGGAKKEFDELTGSVKSLKDQVKEAQKEAQLLSVQFGDTSAEAVAAQKKLAGLKDELTDFNERIRALDPGNKFKAIGDTVQGLAGGFSAAQGAAALFGGTSEELEKTMVKLQGALALSQGIDQIRGLDDAFGNLKLVATDAFNGIKKTFLSNPFFFGAAAIVTAIAGTFAYLSTRESESEKKVREYNESLDKSLKIATERLNAIEKGYDREITLAKAAGKETFELEQKKLQTTIQRIFLEIEALQKKRDFEKTILKEFEQGNKIQRVAAELAQDEFVKREKTKNKEIKKLTQEVFDISTQLQANELEQNKKNTEKYIENAKKREEAEKKRIEEARKALLERQRIAAEVDANDLAFIENGDKRRQDELDKQAEFDALLLNASIESESQREAQEEAEHQRRLKRKQDMFNAEVQIATDLTSILGNLGNIFIKNQQKNEEFQKKVAIVQLGIDTAKAISGAVAQAQSIPFPGNIAAIVAGIAAVTANIAKAKQLLSKVGSSGSIDLQLPQGSSFAASLPEFANQPQLPQGQDINQQQADTSGQLIQRVFVTEGDIRSANQNQDSILTKSTIE